MNVRQYRLLEKALNELKKSYSEYQRAFDENDHENVRKTLRKMSDAISFIFNGPILNLSSELYGSKVWNKISSLESEMERLVSEITMKFPTFTLRKPHSLDEVHRMLKDFLALVDKYVSLSVMAR